ncbi:hypothetical protein NN561_007675 [Cricetulus griseus]
MAPSLGSSGFLVLVLRWGRKQLATAWCPSSRDQPTASPYSHRSKGSHRTRKRRLEGQVLRLNLEEEVRLRTKVGEGAAGHLRPQHPGCGTSLQDTERLESQSSSKQMFSSLAEICN